MPRGLVELDAAVLGDGTVLVLGEPTCTAEGATEGSTRADVYDPSTDSWIEVESLNKPRRLAAAVALHDGSALVAGGMNGQGQAFSSTRIFDPSTRTWRDGGLLNEARIAPAMAVLADGRALIAGGVGIRGVDLSSAETFDPVASTWRSTAPLPDTFYVADLVGLTDGRALAIGLDGSGTEPSPIGYVFDPTSRTWSGVDGPPGFQGDLLAAHDGAALVIGGADGGELFGGDGSATDWITRFDPGSGRWVAQEPMSSARLGSQAVVLADGRVLIAGGATRRPVGRADWTGEVLSGTEVFDPSANDSTEIKDLLEPRKNGVAVLLHDGSVVAMGGDSDAVTSVPACPVPLTSLERYYPAP